MGSDKAAAAPPPKAMSLGPRKADENPQFRDFLRQHLKTRRMENYNRRMLSFALSHVYIFVVGFFGFFVSVFYFFS